MEFGVELGAEWEAKFCHSTREENDLGSSGYQLVSQTRYAKMRTQLTNPSYCLTRHTKSRAHNTHTHDCLPAASSPPPPRTTPRYASLCSTSLTAIVWIAILHFGVGIFLFPMIICNVLLLLRCPTIVSDLEDVSTPGSKEEVYRESLESSDVGGNKILPLGGPENTGAVVQAGALVGGEVQQQPQQPAVADQPMGGQPVAAAAEATGAPVMI